MTTSTNLGITHLEENANSPEVRVNEAVDNLDESVNSRVTINFASDANLTLSTGGAFPNQWQYGFIRLTDTGVVLTATREVIVPVNQRSYSIRNDTAQILTVKTSAGTGVNVAAGTGAYLHCDGTNVVDKLPGVGSGETNTASNIGTAGVGVFKQKSGVDFEFKKLNTSSAFVTITDDTGNNEVDIDVAVDIDDITPTTTKGDLIVENGTNAVRLGVGANGLVLTADSAEATGLKWAAGGSTDADAVHLSTGSEISTLTTVTVASGDYILIEDVSDANTKKKILASDLLGAASLPVPDSTSIVEGSADATKELRLEVDGLTTSTTRVWTVQDVDLTVAGTNIAQTYTAAQRGEVTTLTSSTNSVAVNLADSNNFELDMTENTTLAAPTNATEGQSGVITITQDASTAYTLAYNTFWEFEGGSAPALSTTLSSRSTFVYYVDAGGATATCNLIGPVS